MKDQTHGSDKDEMGHADQLHHQLLTYHCTMRFSKCIKYVSVAVRCLLLTSKKKKKKEKIFRVVGKPLILSPQI